MAAEAQVMRYLFEQGYPVPRVDELSDDGMDLAMERVDGPSMLDGLKRRPWTVRHQGRDLARLHRELHEIPAPDFLRPAEVGTGDQFLHMDLHPLNIVLSAKGPVVIDWARASRGDPDVDVAIAWVLVAAGEVAAGRVLGTILERFRQSLVDSFISQFDLGPVKQRMREVVEWKVGDPHISAREQASMWRVVASVEGSS
jgi:tRNA A-37 threonylcarbamoyl transferase component Bud32